MVAESMVAVAEQVCTCRGIIVRALAREKTSAFLRLQLTNDLNQQIQVRIFALERRQWLRNRLLEALELEALCLAEQPLDLTHIYNVLLNILRDLEAWSLQETIQKVLTDVTSYTNNQTNKQRCLSPTSFPDLSTYIFMNGHEPQKKDSSSRALSPVALTLPTLDDTSDETPSSYDAELNGALRPRSLSSRSAAVADSSNKLIGVGSARYISPQPTVAALDGINDYFADSVTVGNPVKITTSLLSYTVYSCIVRRRGSPDIVVHKRYTDFERLRERLVRVHNTGPNPQIAGMPKLPEKKIVGKFRASFVETRRQGLEDLLMFVSKNQELSNSSITREWFASSLPAPI